MILTNYKNFADPLVPSQRFLLNSSTPATATRLRSGYRRNPGKVIPRGRELDIPGRDGLGDQRRIDDGNIIGKSRWRQQRRIMFIDDIYTKFNSHMFNGCGLDSDRLKDGYLMKTFCQLFK